MTRWHAIMLCALLPAGAEPLMLQPAESVTAGSSPIDVGDHAIPWVTDWNGDGTKDLIVGYRYADKVALFLNIGTDAHPAYTGFTHVQAGGVDIYQAGAGCDCTWWIGIMTTSWTCYSAMRTAPCFFTKATTSRSWI
jgi:hypothetical protein